MYITNFGLSTTTQGRTQQFATGTFNYVTPRSRDKLEQMDSCFGFLFFNSGLKNSSTYGGILWVHSVHSDLLYLGVLVFAVYICNIGFFQPDDDVFQWAGTVWKEEVSCTETKCLSWGEMNSKSNPGLHDIWNIQIFILTFEPFKLFVQVVTLISMNWA